MFLFTVLPSVSATPLLNGLKNHHIFHDSQNKKPKLKNPPMIPNVGIVEVHSSGVASLGWILHQNILRIFCSRKIKILV